MSLTILVPILIVGGLFFIGSIEFVNLANKLYGIKTSTFGRVAIILFLSTVASAIVGVLVFWLGAGIFKLSITLVFYAVAYFLYRKYFAVTFWKFLPALLTGSVAFWLFAIIIIVAFRGFLLEPFLMSGDSMAPTYPANEYLIIEKYDRSVQKGDIILARVGSGQSSHNIIARVIGVPGEIINGTTIQSGEWYLSKDNPSATSTWTVAQNAVIGKPVLDLGQW